ncbi:MAG: hypothetical protein LBM92_05420 [Opitutaceae bacterium]|jgi:hypothetical protein|nr:hypothetical protein [Opitutaceae bacterium]
MSDAFLSSPPAPPAVPASPAAPRENAARAPRFDFPAWLPPMLVKELRQGLRTRAFAGALVGFQFVMVLMLIGAFVAEMGSPGAALGTVNAFFWGVLGGVFVVLTPLRGLAGLRGEITGRNIDLLLLTRLSSWRVVLGKWSSLMAQAALLATALLPYGVVRYFFGSVDLLDDLLLAACLYGVCGVLTAAALWLSALSLFLRVVIAIGFLMVLQVSGIGFYSAMRFGGFFRHFGGGEWLGWALAVFDAALVLVFCLIQAVRQIAPPSENHAASTRLISLPGFIPVPFLAWLKDANMAAGQLVFAVVAMLLMCGLEMMVRGAPMAVQARAWVGRGGWRALAGRTLLPGWQSAAEFAAGGIALSLVMVFAFLQPEMKHAAGFAWLLTQVWPALVAPMVLLTFIPRLGRLGWLFFLGMQATGGVMSAIVISIYDSNEVLMWIKGVGRMVCSVLPVCSFWMDVKMMDRASIDGGIVARQVLMMGALALLYWWRTRPYWRRVRDLAGEGAAAGAGEAVDK